MSKLPVSPQCKEQCLRLAADRRLVQGGKGAGFNWVMVAPMAAPVELPMIV